MRSQWLRFRVWSKRRFLRRLRTFRAVHRDTEGDRRAIGGTPPPYIQMAGVSKELITYIYPCERGKPHVSSRLRFSRPQCNAETVVASCDRDSEFLARAWIYSSEIRIRQTQGRLVGHSKCEVSSTQLPDGSTTNCGTTRYIEVTWVESTGQRDWLMKSNSSKMTESLINATMADCWRIPFTSGTVFQGSSEKPSISEPLQKRKKRTREKEKVESGGGAKERNRGGGASDAWCGRVWPLHLLPQQEAPPPGNQVTSHGHLLRLAVAWWDAASLRFRGNRRKLVRCTNALNAISSPKNVRNVEPLIAVSSGPQAFLKISPNRVTFVCTN